MSYLSTLPRTCGFGGARAPTIPTPVGFPGAEGEGCRPNRRGRNKRRGPGPTVWQLPTVPADS